MIKGQGRSSVSGGQAIKNLGVQGGQYGGLMVWIHDRLSGPLSPFRRVPCVADLTAGQLHAQTSTDVVRESVLAVPLREFGATSLMHAFPTQLFEEFSDEEGNLSSRPVYEADGNPIICREAERRRDDLMERLGSLPAIPTAKAAPALPKASPPNMNCSNEFANPVR